MRPLHRPYLAVLTLLLPAPAPAGGDDPDRPGTRLAQVYPPPPGAPARAPAGAPPAAYPRAPAPRMTAAPPPPPGGGHPTAPVAPPGARPPPRGYYYGPGYYPYSPYYVSPWAYSAYMGAPWYWGWGWGYGYYPVYPEPPPPPPGQAPPGSRINAELAFTGGPTDQRSYGDPTVRIGPGASAGASLRVESPGFGVHAGYDGFFQNTWVDFDIPTALDYFTAHATWSFVSGQSGRLRLEAGISVLNWRALPPYGSVTAVGPDAGVSGQISLVGPFGVQGYARMTPWPRLATDLYAGAALRFGPMAVSGGWRDLRADGGDTAPSLRFAGPQFGVSLLF
ncbi:MAG TPA: hypothetical protein VFR85_09400 [Anaeromyxobacteraceae bacterium]|nr:hypothetical protein [Anaeromyxobacteraceae bacterium]